MPRRKASFMKEGHSSPLKQPRPDSLVWGMQVGRGRGGITPWTSIPESLVPKGCRSESIWWRGGATGMRQQISSTKSIHPNCLPPREQPSTWRGCDMALDRRNHHQDILASIAKVTRHFLRDCPYKTMNWMAPERRGTSPPSGYVCNACQQRDTFIRDCPRRRIRDEGRGGDEGCWFCLANPSVRKHLIVDVGEEAYLARPREPLTTITA